MALTLTPAYGRDYKSKAAVLADFDADKDFIVADFFDPADGKATNKADLKRVGVKVVNIRFKGLRQIAVVKIA